MIVEAEGLTKHHRGRRVLHGVDLAAAEGTVLALLGPNGAGKTTTVRILATLLRPDGGRARIAGHDVLGDPVAVRRAISLTGQFAAVDARQTGAENLVMMGRLAHLGRRAARARAADLLDRFDLTEAAGRRAGTWSGGMQRRLDLAMSLVARPRVVFLDEPTTGLDPASRLAVWDAVGQLVRDGTTLVLTTQYLEEADRLADRVVLLDGGRVTAEGTTDALKARVGGARLEVHLAAPADTGRALTLLDALPVGGTGGRVVALASDGSARHLHSVLDRLAGAGIAVDRVATHRPSLDDAFLALTGSTARSTATPAA